MLPLVERDIGVSVAVREARFLLESSSSRRHGVPVVAGVASTLVAHVALAVILVSLTNPHKPNTPRPFLSTPRLVSVVYLPSAPVDLPKMNLPELKAVAEVITPEPAPEVPLPVPVRTIETVAAAPIAREAPAVPEAPRTAPPPPAPPAVSVGAFPGVTAEARTPVPERKVEVAGFNAPVQQATEGRREQAAVGAFDRAAVAGPKSPGTGTIVDSGFGRPAQPTQTSQDNRVVSNSGFGTSTSAPNTKTTDRSAEVKQAGFSSAAVADTPRRAPAAPAAPKLTPVELISKPTPLYTEQARRLKIEGDVVLEVEFLATGSVRVVRVVDGLGHGLDEAAVQAAKEIRFKPAQDSGRPVDFRTTVHIVFRLA